MNKISKSHKSIQNALKLDGDPDAIIDYYARWASSYDTQVLENYYGLQYIADLLNKSLTHLNCSELNIADVGCGTGLLAPLLRSHGFHTLEGIDLSEEMIAKARESGLYQSFESGIDLHKEVPAHLKQRYDTRPCSCRSAATNHRNDTTWRDSSNQHTGRILPADKLSIRH